MTTENRPKPAASGSPSLSTEINIATRSIHTTLNRLITARLPLALPPHAASPRLYAFGLLHFSHVYLTFESAWHDLTHPPSATNNPALSSLLEDPWIAVAPPAPGPPAPLDPALRALLADLLPPALPRSRRLRRDLAALLALRPVEVDVRLAQGYPGARVAAYAAHIRAAVAARPHVLLAYAWVMYMAIFSGGRWIRAQLAGAGEGFWGGVGGGEGLGERGLAFWSFEGEADGEDVKAAFKARLEGVEGLLSAEQRREVVEEAGRIFEWSIELVEELDGMLDSPGEAELGEKVEVEVVAPVAEKKVGFVAPPPVSSRKRVAGKSDWVRQGGSIAGALVVLGGVCWWASALAGVAMREGWHEGWAGI
ncbi:Heme oxygenase [Neofusicoccum parvum]|uniref:Heme oxygenase n=1 Tax=Neofusicoccum parvum TaxID=310453 RepID=A0ACB5S7M8_9PEZI|nr:Heme oxygenase [Neofusicoccum parvum]